MANSNAKPPQFYSQEQIQQILNVAIARQAYEGEFSRDQLFEIAEDLGISEPCLIQAEQTWLEHQVESQQRLAFDTYRQGKLKAQCVRYSITSVGLLAIAGLFNFFWPPAIICIFVMATRLGWRAWIVFQQKDEEYERAFRRWARNRQLSQFVNRWWTRILSI